MDKYQMRYREKNPEKYLAMHRRASKKWRDANIEKAREKARQWKMANQDRVREYRRRYYEVHRDEELQQHAEYRCTARGILADIRAQTKRRGGVG